MSDFVLTCESAADRTREFFESRNIPVVCFHYEIDDVVYTDDLYQSIAPDEFFAQIAAGAMPKTSQVSVGEYEEFWEPFVAEGKDVLHLALSSGISGTYGSACVAAQMLADRYPRGGKVRVIDSLAASSGFGLLAECAADVRDSGASLDETAAWIEEHKLNLHHWFFSTDLSSYLRGGRISAASAIIGTALKICPLMTVDCEGELAPREKIRTKKRAISEMAKTVMAHVQDGANYSGKCIMSQSRAARTPRPLRH
jgi:DegV family protein with EDD domain